MALVIFVWCTSRSGSSMFAKLLVEHGLSPGQDGRWLPGKPGAYRGYQTYENQFVKQNFQSGNMHQVASLVDQIDFWKGPITWRPKWETIANLRNHKHVCVRRDVEHIVDSLVRRAPNRDPDEARKVVLERMRLLDELRDEFGGVDVYSELLWAGDTGEAERVFAYLGLKLDAEAFRRAVELR